MRWPCNECPEPQPSDVSSFFLFFPQSFSSPDDYIIPVRATCLGCPQQIDPYSEDLKVPLSISISKYNSLSNSTHLFALHSVGHATRQVETGWYKERGSGRNVSCFFSTYCLYVSHRWSQASDSSWGLIWRRPPAPRTNTKTSTICVSQMKRIW